MHSNFSSSYSFLSLKLLQHLIITQYLQCGYALIYLCVRKREYDPPPSYSFLATALIDIRIDILLKIVLILNKFTKKKSNDICIDLKVKNSKMENFTFKRR